MDDRIKSRAEQEVQRRTGRDVPGHIRELYEQGLTQEAIAKELGVHRITVIHWMADFGIVTRDRRALA